MLEAVPPVCRQIPEHDRDHDLHPEGERLVAPQDASGGLRQVEGRGPEREQMHRDRAEGEVLSEEERQVGDKPCAKEALSFSCREGALERDEHDRQPEQTRQRCEQDREHYFLFGFGAALGCREGRSSSWMNGPALVAGI